MSIEDTKVVDFISTEQDGQSVVLSISDHLEWGEDEHLLLLQEKLNTYLAFIESGAIFESYPDAEGKKIKINVICQYQPDINGLKFIRKCGEIVQGAGCGLSHEIFKT
jgi:hypothetical protein